MLSRDVWRFRVSVHLDHKPLGPRAFVALLVLIFLAPRADLTSEAVVADLNVAIGF